MGRRGKAPAPSAHRKARGGPQRNTGIEEPQPPVGAPDRPPGLSEAANSVWDMICPLVGAGVLTRDTGQSLARYCNDLTRWWRLAEWMRTHDEVYSVTDEGGNVRYLRHPNVITYEKLGTSLLRLEQEFGLTPASRTRVHALGNGPAKPKPKAEGPPVMRIAK